MNLGWTMRCQRILRAAVRLAIAAVASLLILLAMGKIAPPDCAPRNAFVMGSRGMVLGDDEVMCLIHDPGSRSNAKLSSFEFQRVRRVPPAKRADDDLSIEPGMLLSAIQMAARLTRAQVDISDNLAKLPLRGDWLVRETASPEEKLRALEKIVAHATGRNIVFEKRTVEREVAIAQGYWA